MSNKRSRRETNAATDGVDRIRRENAAAVERLRSMVDEFRAVQRFETTVIEPPGQETARRAKENLIVPQ